MCAVSEHARESIIGRDCFEMLRAHAVISRCYIYTAETLIQGVQSLSNNPHCLQLKRQSTTQKQAWLQISSPLCVFLHAMWTN